MSIIIISVIVIIIHDVVLRELVEGSQSLTVISILLYYNYKSCFLTITITITP